MDQYAPLVLEYYLAELIAGLSDIERNFYGHQDLSEEGRLKKIKRPCVICALPRQSSSLGYPRGPRIDVAYTDRTEVAIYVETPFRIPNPAGDPDEYKGFEVVHLPTCTAIREWLAANKGLLVPAEITALGCDRETFGLWQPRPQEQPGRRRDYLSHVFHVILQKMEVT